MKKGSKNKGFTLIELMVVVIIIAALAGMVLPKIWPVSTEAKKKIAQGDISNITLALQLYRLNNDCYPSSQEGLSALMSKPASARSWSGPYLEKKAVDPWGKSYQYKFPGTRNVGGFDLWSNGPDEQSVEDDVGNWQEE